MYYFDRLSHELITISYQDMELNEEVQITPIILEVGITAKGIYKCRVRRVLIDTCATKNIFYYKCFKEMGMEDTHFKPSNMALEEFTMHKIRVKGTIKINVTLGSDPSV